MNTPTRLHLALPLLLLAAGCTRNEEPVANRYERQRAEIENQARQLEAEVENDVRATEARLDAEGNAIVANELSDNELSAETNTAPAPR